jgi:hypothetical protein
MPSTATIIANSRTPASAVLQVTNDGVVDQAPVLYTRTNLLAALRAGPLKALLAKTPDWTVFNFMSDTAGGDFLRLTRVEGGLAGFVLPPTTNTILWFVHDAIAFAIFQSGEGQIASTLLVEIRAEHSEER